MRPTKYEKRFADELIQYFSLDESTVNQDGKTIPGKFPTLSRFACNIGVHSETLLNWANKLDEHDNHCHPEFFDAYKRAKEYQTAYIYENALQGTINPTFAIWTAKAVLRHTEQDQENRDTATQDLAEAIKGVVDKLPS